MVLKVLHHLLLVEEFMVLIVVHQERVMVSVLKTQILTVMLSMVGHPTQMEQIMVFGLQPNLQMVMLLGLEAAEEYISIKV